MAYKYLSVILIVVVFGFVGLSQVWQSGQKYEVDRTSPNGIYRVKIELRQDKRTGTRDRTERLKIQYLKQGKIIDTYQAENSEQYEPSMRKGLQVVEWLADNALRIGEDNLNQPFNDEVVVSNTSDEYLRYVEVSYGRFESLRVFDLAPKSQIALAASPGFKPDGSSRYFLG